MPKVFATRFLAGLIERACTEAVAPHLDGSYGILGTAIDISHISPAPSSMKVAA
jgi:predicted thioesterase